MEKKLRIRKIYMSTINGKLELLKGILCVFLLFANNTIYIYLNRFLQGRYSDNAVVYIMKLSTFIMVFVIIIYGIVSWFKYIAKNGESLILLGVPNEEVLFLYCMQRFELLFAVFFCGAFWREYYQISIGRSIIANGLNGCLFLLVLILACFISQYKPVRIILYICAAGFTVLFALEKVNYENAYKLLMWEKFDTACINVFYKMTILKILLLLLLLFIIRQLLKYQGIMPKSGGRKNNYKNNMFGDLLHKMGNHSSFRIKYLWLYRNKEFLLWKISSTLFFIVFCGLYETVTVKVLAGYVIGLLSADYLAELYRFERKQTLIYCMSEYSFNDLLKAHVKSGMLIIGDNVFAVLLCNGIVDAKVFGAVLVLLFAFFMMGAFLSTLLYRKYPHQLYGTNFILLLIIMHIPVLNVGIWAVNYVKGKENWSKLKYEE